MQEAGHHESTSNMPASSLFALESIIQQRVQQHSQNTGEAVLEHLGFSLLCTEQSLLLRQKRKCFTGHILIDFSSCQALYKTPLQGCAYHALRSESALQCLAGTVPVVVQLIHAKEVPSH